MADAQAIPNNVYSDPNIAELLNIMKGLKADVPLDEFAGILLFVDSANKHLNAMTGELQSMREQLAEIKDNQQHPVKATLTVMAQNLETEIQESKSRISAFWQRVKNGAKRAVTAFKKHGKAALNKVLDVLLKGVKSELTVTSKNMQAEIDYANASIAKIDAMASELHAVSAHSRNVVRAARGKGLVRQRDNGKIAAAIKAPYRLSRSKNAWQLKRVNSLINKIEQREERREKEKKPSVVGRMEENKARVAAQISTPVVDKAKKLEASI